MKKEKLLEWFDKFVFSDISLNVARECIKGHEHCQAYQQIVVLIKKEVTEEWIGKKAKILLKEIESWEPSLAGQLVDKIRYNILKNFIRSLVEEINRVV